MPESEVTALNKFPCPACGGEAVWNPAKHKLVCPYCGTESEAELQSDGSLIEENDLVAALRAIPQDQRGWETGKKSVKCRSCQAISVFDSARVAQRCDFCGSSAILGINDIKAPIRPSGMLPFTIPESQVREQIRQWYGSHWFAPNDLKTKALTDTVKGIYLPYWTFDAQVTADWSADSGTYYHTRNSKGEMERHVRWTPVSGRIQHFFDDLLVPASRGVHPHLLTKIEPFPTTEKLVPYDTGYVSGWVVEQYQIDLVASAQTARQRMNNAIHQMCASSVPGDTYRNLRVHPEYSGQTFKHVLLPVWLLNYNYHSKSYQVTVNGVTGKIGGEYPISWMKVALVVFAITILIFILILSQN